jgi:hypothetical protein
MLSNILAVLIPAIIGLAAVFITERLLQKLAFGRLSAEPAVTFDADPNHRLTETSMAEIVL